MIAQGLRPKRPQVPLAPPRLALEHQQVVVAAP